MLDIQTKNRSEPFDNIAGNPDRTIDGTNGVKNDVIKELVNSEANIEQSNNCEPKVVKVFPDQTITGANGGKNDAMKALVNSESNIEQSNNCDRKIVKVLPDQTITGAKEGKNDALKDLVNSESNIEQSNNFEPKVVNVLPENAFNRASYIKNNANELVNSESNIEQTNKCDPITLNESDQTITGTNGVKNDIDSNIERLNNNPSINLLGQISMDFSKGQGGFKRNFNDEPTGLVLKRRYLEGVFDIDAVKKTK